MERTISKERYRPLTIQSGRRRRLVRERWERPVTLRPKRRILVRRGVIDYAPGGGETGTHDQSRPTAPLPRPVGRDQSRPYAIASQSRHNGDSDSQFVVELPMIEQEEALVHAGAMHEAVHSRGVINHARTARPGGDWGPVEDGYPGSPTRDEDKVQEAVVASFPYWIESLYAVEYPTSVNKVAHTHRLVRKHRRRSVQDQRRQSFF